MCVRQRQAGPATVRLPLQVCIVAASLMFAGSVAMAADYWQGDEQVVPMLSSPAIPGISRSADLPPPARKAPPGASEQLLRLQASGGAASRHKQSATPVEQELSNQRLLDSYRTSIPESFFANGAAGGSATSAGGRN